MSRAMEKMESSSMQQSQSSEQSSKTEDTFQVLITTLTSLSERLKKIEEAQVSLMLVLTSKTSTSEDSQIDSLMSAVNEIKQTQNANNELLSVIGETVSDKRVVTLSDGSKVSASELQAFAMMKQINEQTTKTTTALDELKKTVGNGRTVRVDMSKLSEYAVGVLDERLSAAVDERVQRIESTLDGYELEGRIPWTTVGKVAIAVLPLFASLLLVGGLVWGVGSMFGIGPLFGWAWSLFTAASLWWHKVLIAAATLSGAALFIWVVLRVSRWVYEELR